MKDHILVFIVLFCILFHPVASDTSAQLYGSVLSPYQLQVFEEKDITLSLSSIDFPAIKTIIGQKGQIPVLCKIQNSLPNIEELQALSLPTDKTLVQLASIYNFTYMIYNDISIDVLQPVWNAQKNIFELQNLTSISKPSGLSDTFDQAEILFSQEKEIFQVWTKDKIFMFNWDSSQATLSFIKLENIPAGMKGIDVWTQHQILNDYVYFLYSDTPNKIIATRIDTSYTSPVSTEILLTEPTPGIINFYATNNFLYVAQQNVGAHVYHRDTNTSSWNKTHFVAQTGIQVVTGNNYMFATVSQEIFDQFEVTEYIINSPKLNTTFQENSKRVFSRSFTGVMQADDTRIMLLNQNVMFVWYHSIPETVQQDRGKLINSFVFYGQTDFILDPKSTPNSFIYASSGDQMKLYQLSDRSPEINCPIKDLKSTQASEIYYNLEFTGVTCPIKTKLQDHSPENICLYRQELTIKLSGEAFNGIKWGWVVLIGFGFSVVIIGLIIAIYYIMKNRRENQYVRERLYLLKEDKPKESGGNTGRSPRSFFDISVGGESFAPFRHLDRTEVKDDTSFTKGNLEGRILPTRMDETLRSGLSNSPNKIDLEETDSPVREEKDSKNVLKPQKSQMEDDYRETAKTASINLDT